MTSLKIKQYRVFHKDYRDDERYHQFFHAPSAQHAKYEGYLHLQDCWQEVKYIDMRSRLEYKGSALCPRIKHIAEYRGKPWVRAGMKVKSKYDGAEGLIVDGGGSGAYFRAYMTSGASKGTSCYFHPNELKYFTKDGFEIREPEDYLGL